MIQKIFAFILAMLGAWIYHRFDSYFAIIPIVLALSMYKGADEGVWFYWDLNSDSGGSGDSGGDGGGD